MLSDGGPHSGNPYASWIQFAYGVDSTDAHSGDLKHHFISKTTRPIITSLKRNLPGKLGSLWEHSATPCSLIILCTPPMQVNIPDSDNRAENVRRRRTNGIAWCNNAIKVIYVGYRAFKSRCSNKVGRWWLIQMCRIEVDEMTSQEWLDVSNL